MPYTPSPQNHTVRQVRARRATSAALEDEHVALGVHGAPRKRGSRFAVMAS